MMPDENNSTYGDLLVDQEHNQIILTLFFPCDDDSLLPTSPYTGIIPYICGAIRPYGTKILLLDCVAGKQSSVLGQYTQQLISVRYAFVGMTANKASDIRFKAARVNFGDIGVWANLSQFEYTHSEDGSFGYLCRAKPELSLQINDSLTIALSPVFSSSGGTPFSKELTLRQDINVSFEYRSAVSWTTVEQDIDCFLALLCFSLNSSVPIEKISCLPTSSESTSGDESASVHHQMIDVYLGTRAARGEDRTRPWQFAATLSELSGVGAISSWYNQYDLLEPIINLYLIGIRGSAPSAETLFLNLVQGLETFHSRFIEDRYANYEKHVRKMIGDALDWESFLLKDIARKRGGVSLHDRIAYLIFDNGTLPFFSALYDIDPYTDKVVATRNYLTHYSRHRKNNSFSPEELPYVNSELMALIEYHVLLVIGLSRDAARNVIGKRENLMRIATIQHGPTQRPRKND